MVNGYGSRSTNLSLRVWGCILALALTILGGCATGSDTTALTTADGGQSISAPPGLAQNTDLSAGDSLEAQAQWAEESEADEEWDDEDWEEEAWEDEDWEDEEDAAAIADPLMPFNKVMFHLTDNLYYGVF